LIELDVDRVEDGNWYTQWLVYNIPLSITNIAGGQPRIPLLTSKAQQGQNSAGVIAIKAVSVRRGLATPSGD